MVKLVISARVAYSILAIFALLLISVGVYAYNTNSPAVVGHTIGEFQGSCTGLLKWSIAGWSCINLPVTCTGGAQALTWTGTTWSCITVSI